jgi:tRNA-splicing ligase RtcB
VWLMLHSGSRGVGNAIGTHFIELAKQDMRKHIINLPDQDLAYLEEGTQHYDDYVEAVGWAQKFAHEPRSHDAEPGRGRAQVIPKPFETHVEAVNCHHNYVQKERHFGKDVLVTRKGAVSAREGELGIIPGSMGARSFIVRGKGNPESFNSCSHGAGRTMSRTEAKRRFTVEDQVEGDRRRRVPQGRGRDRRDPDGLQGHRRRHAGPERAGGSRAHAQAGGVREGMTAVAR